MEDQTLCIVAISKMYPRANVIFAMQKLNSQYIETVKEGWRHSFLAYIGIYSLCIH